MKKNKGFTLIEVLGVIVLLSLVFLMSYTTILNSVKKSQDQVDQHTLDLITSATKDYMTDNQDDFPEVNNNVFCIDINALIDNNYIDEDTVTAQGNSILSKTVKVTYKKDNNSEYTVVGECKSKIRKGSSIAVHYLLENANPKSVTQYISDSDASHQMYTFDHPATEQTEALTDYRYIGNDPYNYVDFNNELWRIVGVFEVENDNGVKQQRIKLIIDNPIEDQQWNTSGGVMPSAAWEMTNFNIYLNNEYYNNIQDKYKKLIDKSKFYLGSCDSCVNKPVTQYDLKAVDYYLFERKNNGYLTNNYITYFGFIYPSDYLYTYANGVESKCYEQPYYCDKYSARPDLGWLYVSDRSMWTISTGDGATLFFCNDLGQLYDIGTFNYSNVHNAVRPVVYLKSNVKIVSGDGTQSNPYKLSL